MYFEERCHGAQNTRKDLKEGGTQIPPNCPLLGLSRLPWSLGQTDMQTTLSVPQLSYCTPITPLLLLWDQICDHSCDTTSQRALRSSWVQAQSSIYC